MSLPITIRDPTDMCHEVCVGQEDTVSDALIKLCSETDFNNGRLGLEYEGVILKPATKLIDLGIVGGSELLLVTGKDWEAVMELIKKSPVDDIVETYKDVPYMYKGDDKVIKEALDRIGSSQVGDLFKEFPEETQKNDETAWRCIYKAMGSGVADVYSRVSESLKRDEGFMLVALDNCAFDGARDLVLSPPGSSCLGNPEIAEVALRRSYEGVAPIFKLLPPELRSRSDLISLAFRSTYHVRAPDILAEIPKPTRHQLDHILTCLRRCQDDRVPSKVDIKTVLKQVPEDMLADPSVGLQMIQAAHQIYHRDLMELLVCTPEMERASNRAVLDHLRDSDPNVLFAFLSKVHFADFEIVKQLCLYAVSAKRSTVARLIRGSVSRQMRSNEEISNLLKQL
eukprot:TRINITY_DN2841_c0_g1_i1.p1 TRINITY_DN2841_c0_g1~~TRINITY_DN2841_c0_g1_i1.p1  ORF type:complete len:410 (+),score=61.76 TRINITY_DN2841_c0_g1_i1:40-1230(+)